MARDKASRTFDKVGKSAEKSHGTLAAFGRGALKAAKFVGTAAASTAAAATIIGVKSASDIQLATKTLTGLYGSAKQANYTMGLLRKTASKSPIDYKAFAQGAEQLAYMGIKGNQTNTILKHVADAVVAVGGTSADMGRVTTAMLQIQNSGKVYADQLNQISQAGVPIFSGLAKHFHTNISHIREMVTKGKVGLNDVLYVVQHAEGKTFKQLIAASKGASNTLQNQWARAKDNISTALGELFLPAVNAITPWVAKVGRDAPAAVAKLQRAVDGLDLKTKFKTAAKAVGDFLSGLFGNSGNSPGLRVKQGRKSMIDVGALVQPTGAAKLGQKIHDAIVGGINRIKSGDIGSTIGTVIGTAINWFGKHAGHIVNQLVSALTNLDWTDIGQKVGGGAVGFAIGFANGLFNDVFTGKFWKKHWLDALLAGISLTPFGKVFRTAGKLLRKLPWGSIFDFLKKLPWGKILPGFFHFGKWLAGVGVKAFAAASRMAGKIGDGILSWLVNKAPHVAVKIVDFVLSLPRRIGRQAKKFATKGIELIQRLGNALVNHIPGMKNRFVKAIARFLTRFTLWKIGIALVQGLLNGIWNKMKAIGKWIKTHIVNPIVNHVKSFLGIKSPSTVFHRIGTQLAQGLINGIGAKIGAARKKAHDLAVKARNVFNGARKWLVGHGKSFVNGLINGVSARLSAAVAKASQLGSRIRGKFSGAGHWLVSHGRGLVNGLRSGIASAMSGIGSWLKSHVVDPIINAVKRFFGIHSPSTVFHGIGVNMVKGLIRGLATHNGPALVKKIFGGMPSALGALLSKGLVSITDLPLKALKSLASLGGKFAGLFGGGGGSGKWGGLAARALAMLGMPTSLVPGVLRLIARESGGNPRAINLWDINAKRGDPSRGLMQTIGSTFNAYAGPFRKLGIYNPFANIYAGLNYIKHNYRGLGPLLPGWTGGYARGTNSARRGWAWVGERGPELMRFRGGEQVKSHADSMAMAGDHYTINNYGIPGYTTEQDLVNALSKVHRRQRLARA